MAAITLTNMQSRVALNCDNLATTDPVYTNSTSLKDYINEAANRVILMATIDPATRRRRRNFEMFPELRDRRWAQVTVNNQGYLLIPENCLVPDSLMMTKKTAAYDQSRDTEYIIPEYDLETFRLLDKTTSNTGYPAGWCRSSTEILITPTPTTTYLTQVILRGIRAEQDLANASDTFVMHPLWHPAVVDMATSLTMTALGWHDQAKIWKDNCASKIGDTVSLLGASNRLNRVHFDIAGAPR